MGLYEGLGLWLGFEFGLRCGLGAYVCGNDAEPSASASGLEMGLGLGLGLGLRLRLGLGLGLELG